MIGLKVGIGFTIGTVVVVVVVAFVVFWAIGTGGGCAVENVEVILVEGIFVAKLLTFGGAEVGISDLFGSSAFSSDM